MNAPIELASTLLKKARTALLPAALLGLIASCGGGGGGGGNSTTPTPPAPPPFSYTIQGSAVKGVISGATVSLQQANGDAIAGATTRTGADGSYSISFTRTQEIVEPLRVVVDGTGATTLCDVQPSCRVKLDGNGNVMTVNFGQPYDLPNGFTLQASVGALTRANSTDRSGKVHVSPVSEFVTSLALQLGDGRTLTKANLDSANKRLIDLIERIYPDLQVADGTDLSTIPLVDLTALDKAASDRLNDQSLAVTSLAAAVAALVDPEEDESATLKDVIDALKDELKTNASGNGSPLDDHTSAFVARATVSVLDKAITSLGGLVRDGKVTLPSGTSSQHLTEVLDKAKAAVPEITEFNIELTPGQELASFTSSAQGTAEVTLLPDTRQLIVKLETEGFTATAAHIHRGYAGQNGGIMISLEQDPDRPSRWSTPASTVLSEDQLAAFERGELYVNAHTSAHQAGEIRGQILPPGIDVYLSTLEGRQRVPAPIAAGSDFARAAITLNRNTGVAQVHLTTNQTLLASHIHRGLAGVNGPVVVGLTQDSQSAGHWFASDVNFDSGLLASLAKAELYFNTHTAAFPGGDIRGQILPAGYRMLISTLDALQEVRTPPVVSDATGVAALTLDTASRQFSLHVNAQGVDDATAAHIHAAAAGVNGGVIFPLTQDAANRGHWFTEQQTFSAEQLTALDAGNLYVNVHTPDYAGGEIRGQLTARAPGSGDSDGDGVEDRRDAFPNDDKESVDSDKDGVGDNGDKFPSDPEESKDTDSDGVGDNADKFPNDAKETKDTDGDGVGDNSDKFPADPKESKDTDSDGTGDNADACPSDPKETRDSDGDGVCDNGDPVDDKADTDGDGVRDVVDAFPNDPNESADSDKDGVGNNADKFPNDANETKDADNDGVGDNGDKFPSDPNESKDTDNDSVGDNADKFPNDPNETKDTDSDGVGDNADKFPNDPNESKDTDADTVGDKRDNCPNAANTDQADSDNDGIGNACEQSVSFTQVQAIFDANCVACHGSNGGLSLQSPGSYNNLVNVRSTELTNMDRVEPGNADQSYLVWKIEGRAGIQGTRMPQGGQLSNSDIDLIKTWINEGANAASGLGGAVYSSP